MTVYLSSHIGGSYKKDGTRIPTPLMADNGFLKNLKQHWKNNSNVLINGILIGISAGTMNCAEIVYAQPKLEGESNDKEYQRFQIKVCI